MIHRLDTSEVLSQYGTGVKIEGKFLGHLVGALEDARTVICEFKPDYTK